MKNIGLTLLMFLFVGVGTSMAQDKKAADTDAAVVKTEATAKKECTAAEKKACQGKHADAGKKCSHAAASADGKKTCAPGCEKSCCMADAKATSKKDAHAGHDHDHHKH